MDMGMGRVMTETSNLLRLSNWLSPAFPIGAFSYSSGLESAVADKLVTSADDLREWLSDLLAHGALRNDAVFVSLGWQGADDITRLNEANTLANALAGSASRYLEITAQGDAFLQAVSEWGITFDLECPPAYPVVFGAAACRAAIVQQSVIAMFLNAAITNQIQAAIRLNITGQKEGVALLAGQELELESISDSLLDAGADDLGSTAMIAEIAAMNHDGLHSRIFRS